MEVNETRNCVVTDILLNKKIKNRLNGFANGKTRLFKSGGVVKWAYFQKKWSIPLTCLVAVCHVNERRL